IYTLASSKNCFALLLSAARCINTRLQEHARNVKNEVLSSLLVTHLKECQGCAPVLKETRIEHSNIKDNLKRLVLESRLINNWRDKVISQSSLVLSNKAKQFLEEARV